MRAKKRKDMIDKNGHATHRMVNDSAVVPISDQAKKMARSIPSAAHAEPVAEEHILINLSEEADHLMEVTLGQEVVRGHSAQEIATVLARRSTLLRIPRELARENLGMDEDELRQERHRALRAQSLLAEYGVPA